MQFSRISGSKGKEARKFTCKHKELKCETLLDSKVHFFSDWLWIFFNLLVRDTSNSAFPLPGFGGRTGGVQPGEPTQQETQVPDLKLLLASLQPRF